LATLRQHILANPETLSDMGSAADERFGEAENLLLSGRFSGAVYLMGLSSEMSLKLSCFRCKGLPGSAPVDGLLGPVRRWMRTYYPFVEYESYHSLKFWMEYLIALRAMSTDPLPAAVVGQARHHVIHRLYEDWRIDLRYRGACISERQAHRVYQDATWVRERATADWR
jgi:hypothetical protein